MPSVPRYSRTELVNLKNKKSFERFLFLDMMLGKGWKHGKVFGYSRYAYLGGYEYFQAWQPGEWNTACILATTGTLREGFS